MKVFLKSNWSEQFIYGDKTPGFFVGRDQEIKGLKNVINGNNSSAVLVSSIRGVGKTSFVHKTLSQIKGVHPVFVNIGHALANADTDKTEKRKKMILISLIRATYFNKDIGNDDDLKRLYRRCYSKYTEKSVDSKETETKTEVGIVADLKLNFRTISALFGVLLTSVGMSLDNVILRLIVGVLGVATLFVAFTWNRKQTDKKSSESSEIIDDSTEYLEIEFENWLKKHDDKKIVFVIDELDKIDEAESLQAIKEYKNLFNRSFTHFIFISSQKAFELVNEDREKGANDGGVFPTLFTHVFYLPLPQSKELRSYLEAIYDTAGLKEEEKKQLTSYLLFRSGNDFFELKRLISDLCFFDKNDRPFIDTEKIQAGDLQFVRIASLFDYIDEWFLPKNMKELKKHWKQNSSIQKATFGFLNTHFFKNFKDDIVDESNTGLIDFLIDIGALTSDTLQINDSQTETSYSWTGSYNREVKAPLLEEDKKFVASFKELVKVANELDDLPTAYKTKKFSDFDAIDPERDGENLSGISLYSTFADYEGIYKKLSEHNQRIAVRTEQSEEGRMIIDQQLKVTYEKYFEIFVNAVGAIFEKRDDVFVKENTISTNYNVGAVLSSLPNFLSVATPNAYSMSVFGKKDQSKYVLLIRNFEDIEHIPDALSVLNSRTDLLVINLIHGENYRVEYPLTFIDKSGRKRKKGIKVENFLNVEFKDFRQLSDILIRIEKFLT